MADGIDFITLAVQANILHTLTVRTWYNHNKLQRYFLFEQTDSPDVEPVIVTVADNFAEEISLLAPLAQQVAAEVKSKLSVPASLEFASEIILAWMLKGVANTGNWDPVATKYVTKSSMHRPPKEFFEVFPCLSVGVGEITEKYGKTWLPPKMVSVWKKKEEIYEAWSDSNLESIVIHCNDKVKMTREEIADWLDSLHERGIIDLNAQVELDEETE